MGFKVVAIDNREEGRALAAENPLKPDLIVDPNEEGIADKLKEWSGGLGLNGFVVCTDYVDATSWALPHLRPRGTLVELGLPTKNFEFEPFKAIFEELTIKGSLVASKKQTEDMLKTVAKHGITTKINVLTPEEGVKLPDLYMDPHLKGRLVVKFE
jgi:D-arabinose 1-dehydrogenase-like Zn-dependent alcohol dehydrogenase